MKRCPAGQVEFDFVSTCFHPQAAAPEPTVQPTSFKALGWNEYGERCIEQKSGYPVTIPALPNFTFFVYQAEPEPGAAAGKWLVVEASTGLHIWAYGDTREELVELLPYYQELEDARAFVANAHEGL